MKSLVFLLFFGFLCSSQVAWPMLKIDAANGLFSGRVSKVNIDSGLVRIKVQFANLKYVNKKDQIELWNDRNPKVRCKAYVLGRSVDYLLVKVPNFNVCTKEVHVAEGIYLSMQSQDLINNLKMGKELFQVLLKKRLAIGGKALTAKKELDSYIEKVSAVNARYITLREKLEQEWRDELGLLEEDRLKSLRNYTDYQMRLEEIDFKMEKYRIFDENLLVDRWSLDPRLYFKK